MEKSVISPVAPDASDKQQAKFMDTADYIENLRVTYPLREPVLREIIHYLNFILASRGLDVGCGIGQPTLLLAEHLAPHTHITGIDISEECLEQARESVCRQGLSGSVELRRGSMDSLPFEADVFDWAWSVDCAGYSDDSRRCAIRELIRVVRPGGCIALIAWSSQQFLAGHPRLEARLNATGAGLAPFSHGQDPKRHFLRTAGRLYESGIGGVKIRTFSGDVSGPASADMRDALTAFFKMRWGAARSEMTGSDGRLFRRLCDPDSPEFLPDRDDYYGLFTYTVFTGIVDDYSNHSKKLGVTDPDHHK